MSDARDVVVRTNVHIAASGECERRCKYPALLRQPAYAHLEVLRLRHPRETRRLLAAAATA